MFQSTRPWGATATDIGIAFQSTRPWGANGRLQRSGLFQSTRPWGRELMDNMRQWRGIVSFNPRARGGANVML